MALRRRDPVKPHFHSRARYKRSDVAAFPNLNLQIGVTR